MDDLGGKPVPEGQAGEGAITATQGELGRRQAQAGLDHGLGQEGMEDVDGGGEPAGAVEAVALEEAEHLDGLGRPPGGGLVQPGMARRRAVERCEKGQLAGRRIGGTTPGPGGGDQGPDRSLVEACEPDQVPGPQGPPAPETPQVGEDGGRGGLDQETVAALAGEEGLDAGGGAVVGPGMIEVAVEGGERRAQPLGRGLQGRKAEGRATTLEPGRGYGEALLEGVDEPALVRAGARARGVQPETDLMTRMQGGRDNA